MIRVRYCFEDVGRWCLFRVILFIIEVVGIQAFTRFLLYASITLSNFMPILFLYSIGLKLELNNIRIITS